MIKITTKNKTENEKNVTISRNVVADGGKCIRFYGRWRGL